MTVERCPKCSLDFALFRTGSTADHPIGCFCGWRERAAHAPAVNTVSVAPPPRRAPQKRSTALSEADVRKLLSTAGKEPTPVAGPCQE